eukprot:scaffold3028_cov174-Amphora_coffeaeformis.AAC.23
MDFIDKILTRMGGESLGRVLPYKEQHSIPQTQVCPEKNGIWNAVPPGELGKCTWIVDWEWRDTFLARTILYSLEPSRVVWEYT